jgi:phage-related holin
MAKILPDPSSQGMQADLKTMLAGEPDYILELLTTFMLVADSVADTLNRHTDRELSDRDAIHEIAKTYHAGFRSMVIACDDMEGTGNEKA